LDAATLLDAAREEAAAEENGQPPDGVANNAEDVEREPAHTGD